MGKELGSALRSAREHLNMTQAAVASKLGVSRAAVGQWESGDSDPATANLVQVCDLYKISMAQALLGTAQFDMHADAERIDPASTLSIVGKFNTSFHSINRAELAISRLNVGGPADFLTEDEISSYIPRPPALARHPGAYGVYMTGHHMKPRYDEGDLLFLDQLRQAAVGDFVLVRLRTMSGKKAWPCYLRLLAAKDGEKVSLQQFNPSQTKKIALSDVEAIHRIYPWNELFFLH